METIIYLCFPYIRSLFFCLSIFLIFDSMIIIGVVIIKLNAVRKSQLCAMSDGDGVEDPDPSSEAVPSTI